MAAQVTQWLYDNMAWAHWAGATWSYEETQATLAKLFEHFSCTPQLDNASLIYDHILDNNYGLTIRPVTQYLDDNQGVATGVLDFKIEETQDLKFKASDVGIYGQFPVDDLIKMVWQACGLQVQESWQNTYLIRCRQHSTAGKSVCNAHIINSAGTVCVYVNKGLIDLIIEAMDLEGMFATGVDIPEHWDAGSHVVEYSAEGPELAREEILRFFTTRTAREHWPSSEISDQTAANSFASAVISKFEEYIDFTDYKGYIFYINYSATNEITFTFRCFNCTNDTIVTTTDLDRVMFEPTGLYAEYTKEFYFGSSLPITSADLTNSCGTYVGRTLRFRYVNNSWGFDYTSSSSGLMNLTPVIWHAIECPNNVVVLGHGIIMNWQYYLVSGNIDADRVYPEGVTPIDGADIPEVGTTSSDYWSSWVGRAITLQTVSIDTFDFDTTTFIPIGYHDPTAEVTQLDMQLGKIKGREYLQRLGVRLTDMDDFKPITWDPDDPDDPDNQPIKPDPDPTPSPTPVDPSDPSDTSARLFQVHQLSDTEVNALGNFIYSSDFISAITNMFTEPMDAIIGCFRLHYRGTLPIGANERIKLGSILGTSATTGNKITQQFYTITFGSVAIPEHYANVEDYDYTEAEIFLPYIGFCPLSIKDIMAGTVELEYTFDLYTGACIARIYITKNGTKQELYNFNGNSAVMVPLTGRDFTVGVSHLVSGAVGIIAGVATGGASGAISATIGASNLVGKESNIKHSGSCGSNLGAMSNQTPYIVIRRPKAYNASSWPSYYGQPSWWTSSIGSLSGYTRVRYVKLDGLHCTDDERKEIEALLMAGIYV